MDAIRIFISYSHHDTRRMRQLLKFIQPLHRKGFDIWTDECIATGELWHHSIKKAIATSHIAVVLVSIDFLNSAYCQDVEVGRFLLMRKSNGLVIYPIILSACNWKDEEWLASTHLQPRGGRTVEEHFGTRGARDRLFLNIHDELAEIGQQLRAA